jgi:hypothetical protein
MMGPEAVDKIRAGLVGPTCLEAAMLYLAPRLIAGAGSGSAWFSSV